MTRITGVRTLFSHVTMPLVLLVRAAFGIYLTSCHFIKDRSFHVLYCKKILSVQCNLQCVNLKFLVII
jgi:hypothetical protein